MSTTLDNLHKALTDLLRAQANTGLSNTKLNEVLLWVRVGVVFEKLQRAQVTAGISLEPDDGWSIEVDGFYRWEETLEIAVQEFESLANQRLAAQV